MASLGELLSKKYKSPQDALRTLGFTQDEITEALGGRKLVFQKSQQKPPSVGGMADFVEARRRQEARPLTARDQALVEMRSRIAFDHGAEPAIINSVASFLRRKRRSYAGLIDGVTRAKCAALGVRIAKDCTISEVIEFLEKIQRLDDGYGGETEAAADASPDDYATRLMSTLASRRIFRWNEDAVWRYAREMLPNASDQFLQQVVDRVRLYMSHDATDMWGYVHGDMPPPFAGEPKVEGGANDAYLSSSYADSFRNIYPPRARHGGRMIGDDRLYGVITHEPEPVENTSNFSPSQCLTRKETQAADAVLNAANDDANERRFAKAYPDGERLQVLPDYRHTERPVVQGKSNPNANSFEQQFPDAAGIGVSPGKTW